MPQPIPSFQTHFSSWDRTGLNPGLGVGSSGRLPAPTQLQTSSSGLGEREEGHPRFLGSIARPREVTPFLNEIELPFSSSSPNVSSVRSD